MNPHQEYARSYIEDYGPGHFEPVMVQVRRQEVLRSLSRHPHTNILEVGCGLEPLFTHCSDYAGYTVVEPADAFFATARELARERPKVRLVHAPLELAAADLQDSQFDFIVAGGLLHEVPSPESLLAALLRLCRPHTVVHLNVPNIHSFHRLLAVEMGVIGAVSEPSAIEQKLNQQNRFTQASLAALVQASGFQIIHSGTYFIKPFTHGQMAAMLRAGIINSLVIDGLARMTRYLPDMGCEMFVELRAA